MIAKLAKVFGKGSRVPEAEFEHCSAAIFDYWALIEYRNEYDVSFTYVKHYLVKNYLTKCYYKI